MIKTLNPYSTATTAKTAEIMSRYRPIAPKPEVPESASSMNDQRSGMSQKIRQSPYLRNLWPQLQARPTRTRKRGRAALSPPTFKRPRTMILGLSSPSPVNSPAKNLCFQGFSHGVNVPHQLSLSLPNPNFSSTPETSLVTLPLLPCPSSLADKREKMIDLNRIAEIPEEKDLLKQLQGPPATTSGSVVIAPQPIRPVGSSISVESQSLTTLRMLQQVIPNKKPEEVEEEVESDALPAVITDSNNRVRLANSAYKEMVGQPECPWLDSMVSTAAGNRICGGVRLHLCDDTNVALHLAVKSNGFSCWVKIEWESSQGKKKSIKAFCDVNKLSCHSKHYLFMWRFHTHTHTHHNREASHESESSSNVSNFNSTHTSSSF